MEPVKKFISSFKEKPKVIDLSYGDFCVGSKLSDHCHNYIACDIVEQLINFTKELKYKTFKVDFRALDLTMYELSAA